jgi:hypothetical protein
MFLCCLPLLLAATLALGGSGDLWIHVYVQEGGEHPETVRVNVPLSLVESVLPLIECEEIKNGRVQILDEIEAEGIDLKAMWEALRSAEDGEYVTVESDDGHVRVAKADGLFLVKAEEDEEKVNVRIPLDVVDALFSSEEGELDILAAVQALGRHSGQDVVTVEDGSSRVRIWIDDRQEIEP